MVPAGMSERARQHLPPHVPHAVDMPRVLARAHATPLQLEAPVCMLQERAPCGGPSLVELLPARGDCRVLQMRGHPTRALRRSPAKDPVAPWLGGYPCPVPRWGGGVRFRSSRSTRRRPAPAPRTAPPGGLGCLHAWDSMVRLLPCAGPPGRGTRLFQRAAWSSLVRCRAARGGPRAGERPGGGPLATMDPTVGRAGPWRGFAGDPQ